MIPLGRASFPARSRGIVAHYHCERNHQVCNELIAATPARDAAASEEMGPFVARKSRLSPETTTPAYATCPALYLRRA